MSFWERTILFYKYTANAKWISKIGILFLQNSITSIENFFLIVYPTKEGNRMLADPRSIVALGQLHDYYFISVNLSAIVMCLWQKKSA